MHRSQLDQVRHNTPDFQERAVRILAERRRRAAATTPRAAFERSTEGVAGAAPEEELALEAVGRHGIAEAIVLSALRPAFFLTAAGIDTSDAVEADPELLALINGNKAQLEKVCTGVGRVDLINHFTLPFAGTGFLIDEGLVVTNRHVAVEFAERLRAGYRMRHGRFGSEMEARLDYHRFLGGSSHLRADVTEILYIARDNEPDFALLRVRTLPGTTVLPLLGQPRLTDSRSAVAVVGYPAEDGHRNDQALMDEIFRGQYEVKRLAPGYVTSMSDDALTLMSDYSSLGGNSGSPVISLEDGNVLGLHFAGRFMENNYAVAADVIEAARREVLRSVAVTVPPAQLDVPPAEAPTSAASEFAGRNGYDPAFLGTGALAVPLPGLGNWKAAPVEGAGDDILRYRNFSVIQSKARRLPLLTAVNIDGALSKMLKREGSWKLDGRLALADQIGNELYVNNALDRGHMVRRRDPGWGDAAQEGEADTFHYTNSAPQHEDLNQKDWVGLEDYVLEAAETRGFKVSVLTGPVFRDSDRRLREQPGAEDVQIPEEFWKIAVMVNADTGQLSATGYVLSQGQMIRRLVESAFVFGSYKTYQVRIALIAEETGLDFSALVPFDPLETGTESPFAGVARQVDGPESLVLSPPAVA